MTEATEFVALPALQAEQFRGNFLAFLSPP